MSGSWKSATVSVFFWACAASVKPSATSAATARTSPRMILRMSSPPATECRSGAERGASYYSRTSAGGAPAPRRHAARTSLRGREPSQRLLAQLHLLDLARARHRKVVHEDDVARDLEASDPSLAVREHVGVGERVACLAPDEGHAHLGQARVREAHDRGQVDAGEPHQEGFNLHRVDVLAADLEHVLVAPHEAQMPVAPHDAHVARVQPPVAIERLRGLRGL